MAGGWGCPHELNEQCQHVKGRPCDPGLKGCVLAGRFRFSNEAKNRPPLPPRRNNRSAQTDRRGSGGAKRS